VSILKLTNFTRHGVKAFQCKNVEAILDLLTPDYVLWPTGAPAIGRDSLAPRLAATLSAYDITPSFEREERVVAGELAFERGWDIQRFVRVRAERRLLTGSAFFLYSSEELTVDGDLLEACHNQDPRPKHSCSNQLSHSPSSW
jgi:hypothetical protein